MFIIYFDEVKYQPCSNNYYWLAGLVVPATVVRTLERQVADLAQTCFDRSRLSRQTEFHAAAVCNRADNFKTWTDVGKRISVLKQLLQIVDNPEVFKVWVRLEPARMVAEDKLGELAFMFFVEKVDNLLKDRKAVGLLIGDAENDKVSNATAQTLSTYREDGTPYEFGRDIEHLIDTVHFTHSHLSRMLQLADVTLGPLSSSPLPHRTQTLLEPNSLGSSGKRRSSAGRTDTRFGRRKTPGSRFLKREPPNKRLRQAVMLKGNGVF